MNGTTRLLFSLYGEASDFGQPARAGRRGLDSRESERGDMGFWREDRVLERKDGVLVRKDRGSREKTQESFRAMMGFQRKGRVPERR